MPTPALSFVKQPFVHLKMHSFATIMHIVATMKIDDNCLLAMSRMVMELERMCSSSHSSTDILLRSCPEHGTERPL